ncbi:hypothetical protein JTB14_015307 [Gonioctena quinquepunctata]|nr:hypothetical protein JTB14_015307 [Gonioctena quinquepunctata]
MKVFMYFILCVWQLNIQRMVCMNTVLSNYLQEKSAMLHDTFNKQKHQLLKKGSNSLEFEKMINITYQIENEDIKTITFVGENRLLSLDKIPDEQRILFNKVVLYNHSLFTLSRMELGEAYIYGFNEEKHFYIQTLFTPYSSDAHFFICNDNLYLVIVSNNGDNLTPTTFYKWLGYNFDEIQTIFTTGAIKVDSFSSDTSEVIIILQNLPDRKIFSDVYEFRYEKIKKIQYIQTVSPVNLDTYISKHNKYVIVYEQSKKNMVYLWNGFQLTYTNEFESEDIILKSDIYSINGSSLLIVPQLNKVQVYRSYLENIHLEDEQTFSSNYSVVLDIQSRDNGSNLITSIVGLVEGNQIYINIISFKMNLIETGNEPADRNILRECFNSLEEKIYLMRNKLNETKTKLHISTDDTDSVFTENYSNTILGADLKLESEIERDLRVITSRLESVNTFLNNYTITPTDTIIVNGDLTVEGSVKSDELTSKNMLIKSVNGQKWIPEQWLKYEEPQTITGPVEIHSIKTEFLETSSDDPLFKDLLLKTGNQTITGSVSIGNLTADKIYADKINSIPMKNIFLKSNPKPIMGVKTFKNLDVNEMKVQSFNEDESGNMFSQIVDSVDSKMNFDSNVIIDNLEVDTIDNIDWDEFVNSVFMVHRDSQINGPLTFSKLKTMNLNTTTLNGVETEDLLTISTDQIIHSDVKFNRIFIRNITAETVNDINLLESAVSYEDEETIRTPVTFEKLNIVKDLEIAGKFDDSLFWKNGDHIIGTIESDLLQRYDGKVKIKGNLYLRNLALQPKTTLVVSGNKMDADIANIYWTKSTNQNIEIHVIALQGLSTPHILTNVLNDIRFGQYMLNNDDEKLETNFRFKTVTVKGDVILGNTAQHHPDVRRLAKEAVKTNGSFIINGKKIYEDTLKTEKLATLELDGIDALDVLNTKYTGNVTGTKSFKDLTVVENMNSSLTHVRVVNDVNIDDFMKEVIFIDQPKKLSTMDFAALNVGDLFVNELNKHSIEEYVTSSKKLLSSAAWIENLIIGGNITVRNVQNLATINNISFDDLLKNAPSRGELGEIVGDVKFSGKITVGDLATSFINNIDLKKITKRFLFRKYHQSIIAPYSFGNIQCENIITTQINNITVDNLIDVSSTIPQEMNVNNNTKLTGAVLKSIEANEIFPCSLTDILEEMRDLPSQNWSEIQIKGNVTLLDDGNILYRMLENSVKTNTENVIYSPVKISNHVRAENVETRKLMNNVDLAGILDDAVMTDSITQQNISVEKWFSTIRASEAKVLGNADIRFVNGVDVHKLQNDIVGKNEVNQIVIRGKKTFFAGLQVDRLHTNKVSELEPENLVQIGSSKTVASAIFESLDVENDLNVTFFNNINFQNVLHKRLLLRGVDNQTVKGAFFFDNFEAQNLFTPTINDIKITNIIFDEPNQIISSPKRFKKKVEVFGNITTDLINDISISEEHRRSVLLAESMYFNESIRVLRPSQIFGNVRTESINGYPISKIEEVLARSNIKTEVQQIYHLKDRVIENVQHNINAVQELPREYMYLEKSDELQISVRNTVSASTVVSKGFVLIHVTGHESGEYCGLPDNCQCPQQFTMEISPENSVTTFPNKGYQRIFSYDDERMIVYLTTNSVSTSSNCSTGIKKVMNELSMMTWNTIPTAETNGSFFQYHSFFAGYISKVEFFTLENKTYAIIGRYYDPVLDSYDLDCTVIKFNENRMNATEIQKIPTKAAREIHLVYTAQGVVLIIGSIKDTQQYDEEDETQILRFNPLNEKFELLRRIPSFGCSDATGVVLGADSLIILAHKLVPIQVLKYYADFDNYYLYESLVVNEPVIGITTFYIGGFGVSDAHLCVTTDKENYFIYEFRFLEGWKLKSRGHLDGLRNFVPFELNRKSYIFAPSSNTSALFTIVKNGPE